MKKKAETFLLGYLFALGYRIALESYFAKDGNKEELEFRTINGTPVPIGKKGELKGRIGKKIEKDQAKKAAKEREKDKKIKSIKIDLNGDSFLPELNIEDLRLLGVPSKKVLLKEIIEKNKKSHGDIKEDEYAKVIGTALYKNDMIKKGTRNDRNYYQFIARTSKKGGVNALLEIEETKDCFEIVNFYKIRNKTIKALEKREGIK